MKKSFLYVLILGIITIYNPLCASDTLVIKGTQISEAGETMVLNPGQIVLFDEGATLVIKGGLLARGSDAGNIHFASLNPEKPGIGIVIKGQDEATEINMENVHFTGLIQALRFDPFWERKSVLIYKSSFNNFHTEEPVIFVASPFINFNREKPINFTIKSLEFYNNNSNLLFESFGSRGIVYDFNDLIFAENIFNQNLSNSGVLHLECSAPINRDNIKVNNLAFNRNFAGIEEIGITLGGPSEEELWVQNIYQENPEENIHYDRNKNIRIPKINTSQTLGLSSWPKKNYGFLKSVAHQTELVTFTVHGNLTISELMDSEGNILSYTQKTSGDSLSIFYNGTPPSTAKFTNGLQIKLPEAEIVVEPIALMEGEGEKEIEEKIDSSEYTVNLKVFKIVPGFEPFYEVGIWYGTGIYGGYDIKWKFFPIPATLEWSMGAFGEYRFSPDWSARASYYYTKISAHNVYAPGFLSGSKPPIAIGNDVEKVSVYSSGYQVNFLTKIHMLEGSVWWHPQRLGFNVFKRRLSSSMGGGIGVFHYTPYRVRYIDSVNFDLYNLRKIGTEGQNYLPGQSPYSVLALNLSLGVQLRYELNSKFTIHAEGKLILTTTDYLDDMSDGNWFGGDYEKFVDAAEENTDYTRQEIMSVSPNNATVAPYSPRADNSMNDYFFQLHLGLSYRL